MIWYNPRLFIVGGGDFGLFVLASIGPLNTEDLDDESIQPAAPKLFRACAARSTFFLVLSLLLLTLVALVPTLPATLLPVPLLLLGDGDD